MIENFVQPLDRRTVGHLKLRWKMLIGLSLLALVIALPSMYGSVSHLVTARQAVVTNINSPPEIQCIDETSGVNGFNAGIGGYSPQGTVVSVSVSWGDGSSDSSSQWNYCQNIGFVTPTQLGHIFMHHYSNSGTYSIAISLIDNAGLKTSISWSTGPVQVYFTGGLGGSSPRVA